MELSACKISLLTVATIFVLVAGSSAVDCSTIGGISNGCSVPEALGALIPNKFKSQFTPACDRHDICYVCGYHLSKLSKADCDKKFRSYMRATCPSQWWNPEKYLCQGYAEAYYAAVDVGGWLPQYYPTSLAESKTHCSAASSCI